MAATRTELELGEPDSPSGARVAVPRLRVDFLEIYRQHAKYVWKSARRLGVSPAELDDVFQETFLTVHRLLDRFEPRGSMQGWLFSVLLRVVQHHRRAHTRRAGRVQHDASVDVDTLPGSPARAPDKSVEIQESVRVLEAILDGLDPEKRAVLVLADIEERPIGEIAEILSLNTNTAASRLRLAREYVDAELARHRARDGRRHT